MQSPVFAADECSAHGRILQNERFTHRITLGGSLAPFFAPRLNNARIGPHLLSQPHPLRKISFLSCANILGLLTSGLRLIVSHIYPHHYGDHN